MKEIKNNFKCSNLNEINLEFLQELERREEFDCSIEGMCYGFSGDEIPPENCVRVSNNGGCGINKPPYSSGQSCGIHELPDDSRIEYKPNIPLQEGSNILSVLKSFVLKLLSWLLG